MLRYFNFEPSFKLRWCCARVRHHRNLRLLEVEVSQLTSSFCWLEVRSSSNFLTDVDFSVKLIYRRLCHGCFPGNFWEILRSSR